MKILATLFTFMLFAASTIAQVSTDEKQALLDLYVATNGSNWNTTWDVNTPVKEWHGVTVTNNKVTALNLMFNNLKGHLPLSMGNLSHVESIELSFNQIQGNIPSSIGGLVHLKTFAINSNQVTGNIPTSLGNLTNLAQLHLSSNSLQGTIPASLGELRNLEILNVFDNMLTGTIPYKLSESKSLKKLVIAENEIIVTDALANVLLFETDNENTRFKTPTSFINKTVIAIETSDDED